MTTNLKVGETYYALIKQRNKVLPVTLLSVSYKQARVKLYDSTTDTIKYVFMEPKKLFASPRDLWQAKINFHKRRAEASLKIIENCKKQIEVIDYGC